MSQIRNKKKEQSPRRRRRRNKKKKKRRRRRRGEEERRGAEQSGEVHASRPGSGWRETGDPQGHQWMNQGHLRVMRAKVPVS